MDTQLQPKAGDGPQICSWEKSQDQHHDLEKNRMDSPQKDLSSFQVKLNYMDFLLHPQVRSGPSRDLIKF